jgi:hypothetical protein
MKIAALPPPVSTGSGSKGLSQSTAGTRQRIPLAAYGIISHGESRLSRSCFTSFLLHHLR